MGRLIPHKSTVTKSAMSATLRVLDGLELESGSGVAFEVGCVSVFGDELQRAKFHQRSLGFQVVNRNPMFACAQFDQSDFFL